MPFFLNRDDPYSKIAEGGHPDIVAWSKIGYNDDVDNVEEDMIVQGLTYDWPASAAKMDIVSDSAEDKGTATAGTGARTITIYYLDSTGADKSETVTMNGTTLVTTTASIKRVNNMRVATTGSSNKSVGNITLSETGGTTKKHGYIRAGYTRMRQCVWTVPTGKVLYVTSVTVSGVNAAAGHWCRFTTRATYDDKSGLVLPANLFIPFHELFIVDQSFTKVLEMPTRFPAGVDIKVSALSDASGANEKCSCSLRGYVVTL